MSAAHHAARSTPHRSPDVSAAVTDVAFFVMWASFVAVMAAILLFLLFV